MCLYYVSICSILYRFSAKIFTKNEMGWQKGFYRTNLSKKYILDVTQLEAIDARKVFPCFDQPDMKGMC